MNTRWLSSPLIPSRRAYLTILFLVSFVVRLGVVLGLRNIRKFHGPNPGGTDAVEFNRIALHLVSGQGYTIVPGLPTSFRAPGMPFFLSMLYRLSYENYPLVYLTLILVGALTCVLAYLLAREVLPEALAQISGFLMAVYLPHTYLSSIFLSEILFTFTVGLGLWLLLLYLRRPRIWLLVAVGLCMGYSALARPIALLFPFFLMPALLRAAGSRFGRFLRDALVLAASAFVVVIPWTLRNYDLHHHLVLIATNGGSTFYGANNDTTLHDPRYMGLWISTVYLPHRKEIEAQPTEYSHDHLELVLGEQWVETHWMYLPLTSVYKIARFWLPDSASANKSFVLMQLVGYTPYGILMLLGLFVSLRPLRRAAKPAWLAIHGLLAADLFSSVIFYGSGRFRDSLTPMLMIYAALGFDRLLALVTNHSSRNASIG